MVDKLPGETSAASMQAKGDNMVAAGDGEPPVNSKSEQSGKGQDGGATGEEMEFDEVLQKHLGQFGRYQKFIFFTMALEHIFLCFQTMSPMFIIAVPDHWCNVPAHNSTTSSSNLQNCSQEYIKKFSIPKELRDAELVYSQCSLYNRTYDTIEVDDLDKCSSAAELENMTAPTEYIGCDSWTYDTTSLHSETIVNEWDLVCGKSEIASKFAGIFIAGRIVGHLLVGHLADRFGRRTVILLTEVLAIASGVAAAFMPTHNTFLAMRFLLAVFCTGKSNVIYVLTVELVGPSWRVFHGSIYHVYWAFGYVAFAAVAYVIRDWRTLQLVISVPEVLLLVVLFFVVPESPRWLLVRKKEEQAHKIIDRIARCNGKTLPQGLRYTVTKEKTMGTVFNLVHTPALRLLAMNLWFNWFANGFLYYGLDLHSHNLSHDPFVNLLSLAALEIPAYLFAMWSLVAFGRIWPYAISMVIGSIAMIVAASIPPVNSIAVIVFSMMGKFFVVASYAMAFVYAIEVFPTSIRAVGVACCSTFARLSLVLADYVNLLVLLSRALPLVIFGLLGAGAGLCIFLLPETMGLPLMQTVEQAEDFITNNSVAKCTKCCMNVVRAKSNWDKPTPPPAPDESLDPMISEQAV